MPPPSSAIASTLIARMRRVSEKGPMRRRDRRFSLRWARSRPSPRSRIGTRTASRSEILVATPNAIERLDVTELGIDHLELLPQPFDVAIDLPVIHINVLAVSA